MLKARGLILNTAKQNKKGAKDLDRLFSKEDMEKSTSAWGSAH
jgi:hypothetical protein